MRRTAVILTLLILLRPAPDSRTQASDPAFERLATIVAAKMKEHRVPGVSLGILRDGVVTTRGFGVTTALKEYFAVGDPDPTPSATQSGLASYAARYSRSYSDVVVTVENGAMHVQSILKRGFPNASAPVPPPGPRVPYAFYPADRAVATGGPQKGTRIDFIRAPDGSIGWVRAGGRIHRRTGASS